MSVRVLRTTSSRYGPVVLYDDREDQPVNAGVTGAQGLNVTLVDAEARPAVAVSVPLEAEQSIATNVASNEPSGPVVAVPRVTDPKVIVTVVEAGKPVPPTCSDRPSPVATADTVDE